MGNTYSFIAVCEAHQKTGSQFFINGVPQYLEIVPNEVTKGPTKDGSVKDTIDGDYTMFNKGLSYLYRLDDGRYGSIDMTTGEIHAFDGDAELAVHRFFFQQMAF
jgi:hypothetical protein